MKGRNIATILRTTDNIIHYVRQLPGLSVAEDFTKAFDTVSKMFIWDGLKLYTFGPDFFPDGYTL